MIRTALALCWSLLCFIGAALCGILSLGQLAPFWVDVWGPLWGWGCLYCLGVKAEVVGADRLKERKSQVVICNHQSILDVMLVAVLRPRAMLVLGKKELLYIPFFNLTWWALGQVFLDRKNPEAARASLDQVIARLKTEPRSVVIAPEGTRSRSGKLGPFKKGAFVIALKAGIPIVRVRITGAWAAIPPSTLLVQWPLKQPVRIEVCEEIPTVGWTEADLPGKIQEIRQRYLEELGEA